MRLFGRDRCDPATPRPVRVLWGFGRWSRAQLLGELAQQEWGMCPGLAEDLETESLHLWEQVHRLLEKNVKICFHSVQLGPIVKASFNIFQK